MRPRASITSTLVKLTANGKLTDVVLDDRTVTFIPKTVLGKRKEKGVRTVAVHDITSVTFRPSKNGIFGPSTGSIAFSIAGAHAGIANTVDFEHGNQLQFERLRDAIKAAANAPQTVHVQNDSRSDGDALADNLAKLAQLHAAGALTESEFRAAKQRLIGGA